jgi:hypothetical protein
MRAPSRTLALIFILLFTGAAIAGKPQTAQELQAKFEQEPDVMKRAKLMVALSRQDFHEISQKVATGDNTDALQTLQRLVNDAQTCSDELDSKGINAENHPDGFKQLQIATRESLRRLDYITVGLTADEQAPFLALRKDLDQLNRRLIRELFPRQPQPPPPPDELPQTKSEVKP